MTNDAPDALRTPLREIDRTLDRQVRAITRFRARLDALRTGERSRQPTRDSAKDTIEHGGHDNYGEAHE